MSKDPDAASFNVDGGDILRQRCVTHELPDTEETVLYDEAGSELLVLNDVGAAIWYLVDGKRSVSNIVEFLENELDDAPADADRFVLAFVQDLVGRGALEVISGDD